MAERLYLLRDTVFLITDSMASRYPKATQNYAYRILARVDAMRNEMDNHYYGEGHYNTAGESPYYSHVATVDPPPARTRLSHAGEPLWFGLSPGRRRGPARGLQRECEGNGHVQ